MKESVEMGRGQSHELCLKLEQAGLNSRLAQEVINAKNNELAKKMIAAILPPEVVAPSIADNFEKLAEFKINVAVTPSIDILRLEHGEEFSYFNSDITDKNFNPSQPLLPGATKTALIYRLKKRLTSEKILTFISSQNGQLPNAQGLTITWEQGKANFPKGLWVIGFDQKENLWKDSGGSRRVPRLGQGSGGGAEFGLGRFEHDWDEGHCILFFHD